MSVCNRADADFNEQACAAAGGIPHGETAGGGSGAPTMREGADGTMMMWNGTEWVHAPAQFQPQRPTVPVRNPGSRTTEALAPLFDLLGNIGINVRPPKTPDMQLPLSNPMAQSSLGIDPATYQRVTALVDAGLMTAGRAQDILFGEDGYGSGSGGGGITAYQAAQMARQEEQDRVQAAMNEIALLGQAQARQDALAQQAQDNRLAALPYLAPANAEFMPGFEADAYGVRSGMIKPMPITRMAFDPAAQAQAGAGYDDPIARKMAEIAMMSR